VKVLEIVAGSFATGLPGEDLAVPAALAPAMNAWQTLEEKPGAARPGQQRPIMIGRQRVRADLDISEVLPERSGHVLIEAATVRHGSRGVGPGLLLSPSSSRTLSARRLTAAAWAVYQASQGNCLV
jgi:hypothetical protein